MMPTGSTQQHNAEGIRPSGKTHEKHKRSLTALKKKQHDPNIVGSLSKEAGWNSSKRRLGALTAYLVFDRVVPATICPSNGEF